MIVEKITATSQQIRIEERTHNEDEFVRRKHKKKNTFMIQA